MATTLKQWLRGWDAGHYFNVHEDSMTNLRETLRGSSWIRPAKNRAGVWNRYYLYDISKLIEIFGKPRWEIPKNKIVVA